VKSYDQLGGLAESFNRMIESVQGLMVERVEKERMERELEIAQEVQSQLFPRKSPSFKGWRSPGCVSRKNGQRRLFRFPQLFAGNSGRGHRDICGRDLRSAADGQSASDVANPHLQDAMEDAEEFHRHLDRDMVSGMIEQINRHIYGFTSPNKFASLFSVVFDRTQGRMKKAIPVDKLQFYIDKMLSLKENLLQEMLK